MKRFKNFAKFDSEVGHFITTKDLGNQALHTGDRKEIVLENRKKMAVKAGVSLDKFIFLDQVHKDHIISVEKNDAGSGVFEKETAISSSDGVVTKARELCLVVLVADCVPMLFFDKKRKVIAVVHGGWQGTLRRIAKKMIKRMKEEFSCNVLDIIVGIGPSIGPCCFEVKKDVFNMFKNEVGIDQQSLVKSRKGFYVDLWNMNKSILLKEGILLENIEISKHCTVCGKDEFFSVRRKFDLGRNAIGIYLK